MFFDFKQKTAYEMRISDWSSDVCSSDLVARKAEDRPDILVSASAQPAAFRPTILSDWTRRVAGRKAVVLMEKSGVDPRAIDRILTEIGRASCRERVCQYV